MQHPVDFPCEAACAVLVHYRCKRYSCNGKQYAGGGNLLVHVYRVCLAVAAYELAEWDESGYAGYDCKYDKGNAHACRCLMWLVRLFAALPVVVACKLLLVVALSPENEVVEAEHVEGCHCGYEAHEHTHGSRELIACDKNLILAEESAEWRYARDGKACDEERDMRYGHVLAQAAHLALFVAVYGMYYGACPQEQQSLEHCVGEQVEH